MKESEELAAQLTGKEVTRGQYGIISVYEEYGRRPFVPNSPSLIL
jgi:hypothetical protein